MLDFKELPKDGNEFELLIREILFSKGLRVFWSGKGPDGGRDLLCTEESPSIIMSVPRKWLVECKHNAHSETAVSIDELDDIVDSCTQHDATGYLLACSTYPSSTVVNRLEAITRNPASTIIATYWDAVTIERMLNTPSEWPIAQRFFPISGNVEPIRIYGTERPNHWVVSYKGYFFHLANRVGSRTAQFQLAGIRQRITDIEAIRLPDGHMLRPRAAWYDDKNGCYRWYIDYLFPAGEKPAMPLRGIRSKLGDGGALEDGQIYHFDVLMFEYNPYSDHFDRDHSVSNGGRCHFIHFLMYSAERLTSDRQLVDWSNRRFVDKAHSA